MTASADRLRVLSAVMLGGVFAASCIQHVFSWRCSPESLHRPRTHF